MLSFFHDSRVIRTSKSLTKALYYTLGVFLAFFVLFHIGISFYVSSLGENGVRNFNAGIAKDLSHLKKQGDEVAKNPFIIDRLLSKDSAGLLEIMQEERKQRSIGLMGITNSEGVIVSRTLTTGKRGDNVFLTAPVGRIVAQGKSAESVELTSFFGQLFLTTGRPIIHNGNMVGGLFANYLTDDVYAFRFRDAYLKSGDEILFYTKEHGVYGSSFKDEKIRELVNSYFNSGSEWIKDGRQQATVSFGDGTTYLVQNVIFPGVEESPGGAIIFIPRWDVSSFANILTSCILVLIFIFFVLKEHRNAQREVRGWRYVLLVLISCLPIFVLVYFSLSVQNSGRIRLERIPYPLYNSTVHFQPEAGVFDVGVEQSFTVVVHSGDEQINAVEIGLVFDPKSVEIKALDTKDSVCSYFIENTIDQKSGTATLSCIILNAEVGKSSLQIVKVLAVPLRSGEFTLAFDSENTKVLANDGLGTNVLRMSQNASYQVEDFSGNEETATGTAPVIFSPTHQNRSRWYNQRNARFVWRGTPETIYTYVFDTSRDTIPGREANTVRGTAIELPIPGDGIFYFHLKKVGSELVSHYRIQSDRTPPSIITLRSSQDRIVEGDVVRFEFDAEDIASGIQQNYYIDLGNHLFLPVGRTLFLPLLEAGDQNVILRVYDSAGNFSEKTQVVRVDKK